MRRRALITAVLLAAMMLPAPLAMGQFPVPDKAKLAHFHLTGPIQESPGTPNPFDLLASIEPPASFKTLLDRFKKARDDDEVKAVVITFESPMLGLAQIEELRKAIQQIRAADKEVYFHTPQVFTGLYALATSASEISVVPTGDVWITGFYSEAPYLKGLLDKMHVSAQFIHFEEYKAAGETLYRTGPSEPAQENMEWLLDSLYGSYVEMIADARQIPAKKVREIIDNGPYTAEQALELGLIDSIKHRQDFVADLKERYRVDKIVSDYGSKDDMPEIPENPFEMFNFFSKLFKGVTEESHAPSVAIVYVEGGIEVGSEGPPNPLTGGQAARSEPIRKALDKAAKDDSVKAVVLRVDSPGGSALASEIILDASKRVASKKPLIVSMGNVAASGGYYVACGSHAIFADATTITASIGVVGGKLITTEGWESIGVNWHEYERGRHAGIMSSAEHWTDSEKQKIHDWMAKVFRDFKQHVVDARGDKLTKPIEEIAGGRVFTGQQALELGLVDRIGGLDEAVKYAAAEANIGDYEIRVIPRPKDPLEMLVEMLGGGPQDEDQLVAPPAPSRIFGTGSPLLDEVLPMLRRLEPQRVQALMQTLQCLDLVNRECVVTMMPQAIVIH